MGLMRLTGIAAVFALLPLTAARGSVVINEIMYNAPGKLNTSFSPTHLPVISRVTATPEDLLPGQPLQVEAEVTERDGLREVTLRYQVFAGGVEGKEAEVAMTQVGEGERFRANIPAEQADTLVRYRIRAVSKAGAQRLYPAENDLRPTLSAYVHEPWNPARIPFALVIRTGSDRPDRAKAKASALSDSSRPGESGGFVGPGARSESRPPRGSSAFLYVDPKTGKTTLFDHVNVVSRDRGRRYRGYKVFFHKDRPLNGMSAINLVMEGREWALMSEALAFDLYRRAGSVAPLAEFVRLWVDGKMSGYHLMVERPNRSFLRRNRINDEGNLYKIIWFGQDIISQHDKKTNTQTGHGDLLAIIDQLRKTKGDEQWKVIQENFNIDQVATYFAVNTVLSHWDGFFNNYFAYHDTHGTKKWEIYPWDQDNTWGLSGFDGFRGDVFFNMPLTFGMDGDQPPGAPNQPAREDGSGGGQGTGGSVGPGDSRVPFRGGPGWWRPAGHFSGPLLANPQFRKVFLARTKEILDGVYTKEVYFPLIDEMADRLREDIIPKPNARRQNGDSRTRLLERTLGLLKSHLLKRRQFLLEQAELRALGQEGASDPTECPNE